MICVIGESFFLLLIMKNHFSHLKKKKIEDGHDGWMGLPKLFKMLTWFLSNVRATLDWNLFRKLVTWRIHGNKSDHRSSEAIFCKLTWFKSSSFLLDKWRTYCKDDYSRIIKWETSHQRLSNKNESFRLNMWQTSPHCILNGSLKLPNTPLWLSWNQK